ncbi:MAG: hypothetical protein F4X40_08610 [Chloroflexi bacterium]|nr:hypothetical protein [Chloroflexota bacterium]
MTLVTLERDDAHFLDKIKIRRPQLGEQIYVVGLAPSSDVGARAMLLLPHVSFISENCRVTGISTYMETNCVTTVGTSGSPMFAASDGALLSFVAWGRGPYETNGPLLFMIREQLRNLVGNNFTH